MLSRTGRSVLYYDVQLWQAVLRVYDHHGGGILYLLVTVRAGNLGERVRRRAVTQL